MIHIFIGKSGSGKDTFLKRAISDGLKPVVSYTTRPIRVNEVDGIDYIFVTPDRFHDLEDSGRIAEARSYNTLVDGKPDTWYYGSPKLDPDTGDEYGVVLDVSGAKSYIGIYGAENLDIVLIDVPDDVREKRARKRGSFDKTEWDRRVADDTVKFSAKAIGELEEAYGRKVRRVDNSTDNQEGSTDPKTGFTVILSGHDFDPARAWLNSMLRKSGMKLFGMYYNHSTHTYELYSGNPEQDRPTLESKYYFDEDRWLLLKAS